MASNIDPARPNVGVPRLTRDGLDDNFTAAKEEIEALQDRVTTLEGGGGGFTVDQYDIAGRLTSGTGALEAIDIAALTDQASPASTDDLLAKRASDGALVKIEIGNLPASGGAVTTVFTRTGDVVAVSGDYDADEITETASNKIMTAAERTKLTGIETGATADQTGAEIKTAYEGEADTNAFTDAEQTKLSGIATGATDDTTVDAHIADAVAAHDDSAIAAAASATNYTPGGSTVEGHLSGIDTALGTVGAVASVFTRTGAVVAVSGDYDADEITETASNKIMTAAERTKLAGIETAATADQTNAEIKTAYEANADTNEFSDAEQTKLAGIETAATADQTGAEIKTAYEGEADTNAFTDAEQTKLSGIATGATDDTTVNAHIADAVAAHAGTAISNAPAGGIAATTVQAAIDELDSEKAASSHTHTLADVTDSGALAALATVDTAQIDNSAVTLAKMADMATDSFIGRDTASTGVPEVLSATTARSVLNVEDGANAPPFVEADYTNGSVTYAKIQDVSAQWRVLGRISSGAGSTEEIDVSALTDQVSPAGGDLILAERASDGNLVHIQVGNLPTGGGGEANLGSNLGAGIGVFETKSGVTLQFNSLVSQNTAFTIAEDDANDEIDFDLDINAATDLVAPATGDELLIGDVSDTNNVKKADLASVVNLADHDALTNFVADEHVAHTGVTLTAGTGLTGGGDISANRSFAVDINGTTDLPAPATGDELLLSDISDTNTVKKADLASIVNLADHDALTNFVADEHVAHAGVTLTAGDGLAGGGTIAASRTFDVDINGTTDLAAPATGDELLLGDISNANAIRKADVASVVNLADHDALTNFVADEHVAHASVSITAGDGLAGGGTIAATRTIDVDINATTDLAAPDRADELLISDASNSDAIRKADLASIVDLSKPVESFVIAVSDETTALTTGTAKVTFRMPYAFTLSDVRASVTTAPTGSVLTVDINETATTILSTKLTIDATEKTSETAATAAVISDSALADDAEMTIDIDGVGSTVAGAGLKVTLIGNQA